MSCIIITLQLSHIPQTSCKHVNENKTLEGPYKFVGKQMYS